MKTVYAAIIQDPKRQWWTRWSLEKQTVKPTRLRLWWYDWKRSEGGKHTAEQMAEAYGKAAQDCDCDYLLIAVCDMTLPENFIERALASDADIYGCPYYDTKHNNRILYGIRKVHMKFDPKERFLQYGGVGEEKDVYPEGAVLIRADLAKKFKWTGRCKDFASFDHLYPFMQWAEENGAKIVCDPEILAVHHKD